MLDALQNPISLPGALVLLAADAGAGWVPLGPTTAKAGRKVATVFEDPRSVTTVRMTLAFRHGIERHVDWNITGRVSIQ